MYHQLYHTISHCLVGTVSCVSFSIPYIHTARINVTIYNRFILSDIKECHMSHRIIIYRATHASLTGRVSFTEIFT